MGSVVFGLYILRKMKNRRVDVEGFYLNNNDDKKTIVHITLDEKWIPGYVNFMKKYMTLYNHIFIIESNRYIKFDNNDNVYFLNNFRSIYTNKQLSAMLELADKIIITGLFNINLYYSLMPTNIFKKTYIHFWGGDFYCLRKKNHGMSAWIDRITRVMCIKRCAGIILLLESEYEVFREICGLDKLHFVAEMPEAIEDINICLDDSMQLPVEIIKNRLCILVGNSATEENQHIDIFYTIRDCLEEEYELYVPLSYGNIEYRETVIQTGQELFGDHFHAIVDYLSEPVYINLLNAMDVGIFNNNRQQAMGNIGILLQLGKTVYIRNNTSMYSHYVHQGVFIRDIQEIQLTHRIKKINYEEQAVNKSIMGKEWKGLHKIKQWENVFSR